MSDMSKLINFSSVNRNLSKKQNNEDKKWERFSHWIHCICIVTFDLELGQALEVILFH